MLAAAAPLPEWALKIIEPSPTIVTNPLTLLGLHLVYVHSRDIGRSLPGGVLGPPDLRLVLGGEDEPDGHRVRAQAVAEADPVGVVSIDQRDGGANSLVVIQARAGTLEDDVPATPVVLEREPGGGGSGRGRGVG